MPSATIVRTPRPRVLVFQRSIDVLKSLDRQVRRGRVVRYNDDAVHLAILQALDEVRGVARVRKGPWPMTAHHVIRLLRAKEPWFVETFPDFFDRPVERIDERALKRALRRSFPTEETRPR